MLTPLETSASNSATSTLMYYVDVIYEIPCRFLLFLFCCLLETVSDSIPIEVVKVDMAVEDSANNSLIRSFLLLCTAFVIFLRSITADL